MAHPSWSSLALLSRKPLLLPHLAPPYARADIEGIFGATGYVSPGDYVLTDYKGDGCWALHRYHLNSVTYAVTVRPYWVHEHPTYGPQVWEEHDLLGPGAYWKPGYQSPDSDLRAQYEDQLGKWRVSVGEFPCEGMPEFRETSGS